MSKNTFFRLVKIKKTYKKNEKIIIPHHDYLIYFNERSENLFPRFSKKKDNIRFKCQKHFLTNYPECQAFINIIIDIICILTIFVSFH